MTRPDHSGAELRVCIKKKVVFFFWGGGGGIMGLVITELSLQDSNNTKLQRENFNFVFIIPPALHKE